jgi:hypothetical protein
VLTECKGCIQLKTLKTFFMLTKKLRTAILLSVISAGAALSSFSAAPGGDSFEILLGGKLLVQQYVYKNPAAASLSLLPGDQNKQLEVRYKHCGIVGKGRSIVIRDEANNVLKEWKFADASGTNIGMVLPVKDIPRKTKNKETRAYLYYSSHEIPKAKLLTSIVFANDGKQAR